MRWTVGIVLAVALVAALAVWSRFPPSQVNPNAPGAVKASSTAIFPDELHKQAGKDLPDGTVRDPF
jgi:hypothetical protein